MRPALVKDVFASVPRVVGEEPGFKKDLVTSAEDSKDRTYHESDGVYHARVLSHFHCGRQRFYPVQITSGQNFANDTGCARVMPGLVTVSSGLSRAFAILPRLKQRRAVP